MFNFTDETTYRLIKIIIKKVVHELIQKIFKWMLIQLEQF